MEHQSPIAAFIPIIITIVPAIILIYLIAPRKGKSLAYALIGLIPYVGLLFAIWLASLPDKSIDSKVDKILRILETKEAEKV